MKVILIVLAVVIVIVGFFIFGRRPDLARFERFKNPQVISMPDQKMLVVEMQGDPNVVGKKAFGALFKTYFRLKGVPKRSLAPRARWPKPLETPKNEWIGKYGLPLPETLDALPEQKGSDDITPKLELWEYGEVAQILHVGSYSEESPTVERLRKFVNDRGYEIAGDHEEEYVKGPGMFTMGNPKKYLTLIRYRVKKRFGE